MKIGRYEIKKQLGQGGMGQVLLGYDEALQREVAVKIMRTGAHSQEDLQRFQREALTASKLSHPGIVTVYEMGQDNGLLYLAMELVEGISFKQLIVAGQVPSCDSLKRNLMLFRQVLEAIEFAHSNGVVHRDLKPDNLMVTRSGQAKVLDFGLAFIVGDHSLTMTGDIGMGTPAYVAPEQIKDFAHTDCRADIYSLGAILYELSTGSPPLEADKTLTLIYKAMNEEPQPPSLINPALGNQFDDMVLQMLRKRPQERYATVGELLKVYDSVCQLDRDSLKNSREFSDLFAEKNKGERTVLEFPTLNAMGVSIFNDGCMVCCSRCGYQNRQGYRFCNNCGHPSIQICPHCGNASNRDGANFCNNCGKKLDIQNAISARELLKGQLPEKNSASAQYTYLSFHRDYIKFGRYPQENSSVNSPIEWLVLERTQGKILVISRYGIDSGRYNCREESYAINWQNCTLRRWLEEEFFMKAFNSEERSLIQTTRFGREDGFGYENSHRGDHIFLLSIAEAERYFVDDIDRCCKPTHYACLECSYRRYSDDIDQNIWWWLRSVGSSEGYAACVHDGGVINDRGRFMGDKGIFIRPAMYINLF